MFNSPAKFRRFQSRTPLFSPIATEDGGYEFLTDLCHTDVLAARAYHDVYRSHTDLSLAHRLLLQRPVCHSQSMSFLRTQSVLSVESGNPAIIGRAAQIPTSALPMSTLPGRLEVTAHTAHEKYQGQLGCDRADDVGSSV
jgi:hypothetical protein